MRTSAVLAAIALSTTVAAAQPVKPAPPPAGTQLHWYGHAAFKIVTPRGKTLLVDPWLANPGNPAGKDEVKTVAADLILVSHGHGDHVGDAIEIGKRTRAKLVATADLGAAIVASGYPKTQFDVLDSGGNFGGTVTVLDGEVAITFVPAVHSSGIGDDKKYGGHPGGFVIAVKGGPTIYHTGDTDVFGDMALVGKLAKIDVMLACIGGHFTMDPARAAEAVRLVKPRQVVPMHFGTFPQLAGTPAQLGAALKKVAPATKLLVLERGKSIVLPAAR
jgi:L-ascorbate metabolism protein UlaG (beta-lactamase superfamily)